MLLTELRCNPGDPGNSTLPEIGDLESKAILKLSNQCRFDQRHRLSSSRSGPGLRARYGSSLNFDVLVVLLLLLFFCSFPFFYFFFIDFKLLL